MSYQRGSVDPSIDKPTRGLDAWDEITGIHPWKRPRKSWRRAAWQRFRRRMRQALRLGTSHKSLP